MKLRLTLLISIGLFVSSFVYSQDIHFTNYSYSPLYLSPAKTGSFLGSYRVGINFREQFSSFIVNPYQTFMTSAEMSFAIGFKPHHWIGAGINVFTDKSGDLDFQNNGVQLSLAYHFAIDPKYKTVITLGLQYGITDRSINSDNYHSGETLRGNNDPDRGLLEDFNPIISDFNIGIALKKWVSKSPILMWEYRCTIYCNQNMLSQIRLHKTLSLLGSTYTQNTIYKVQSYWL